MEAPIQFHKHKGVLDPETGWMITPQEAYLPEEWAEHAYTCQMCGDEFVLYVSDDSDTKGRPVKYCGEQCKQDAHRQDSRESAQRQAQMIEAHRREREERLARIDAIRRGIPRGPR